MDVRILILDDHATVRESLRFVFAAAGAAEVMEATTCAEALNILRHNRTDVVLLEIMSRDENRLDALRKLKAGAPTVAVLVHSHYDTSGLLTQSYHAGAAGYVVKGIDKNALLRAIGQAAADGSAWTAEQLDRIRGSTPPSEAIVAA